MPRSPEMGYMPQEAKDPPKTPEASEDREAVEKFIDAALEELCERYMSKFNEGNNGIVLKLRMDDIPDHLKEGLKKNGIELGDDKVAKILKIYSGGKGRQEFAMQKKAHELVEAQTDKENYARIPKPYFFRDFAVGPDAQARIKGMADKGFVSDRVEMFMMDYVPGDDVATVLYKEVAKRHPKTVDIADRADDLRFEDIQDRVHGALEFKVPGGKSRDLGEREHEMRRVFAENAEKLDTFLERRGFRMDPAVVDQIENTMKLFHKNGLAFRDGHQRNFMISGDYSIPKPGTKKERPAQAFIIDFGAATEVPAGRALHEVFAETEGEGKDSVVKKYPDDFMVVRQLRRFTQEMGAEERQLLDNLIRTRKNAERNPRTAGAFTAAIESAKAGKPDVAGAYARMIGTTTMPSDGAIDGFLAATHAMITEAPEAKDDVRNAIIEIAKRPLPLSTKNRLTRFLQATK